MIMSDTQKKVLVPAAAGVVGFIAGGVSTLFYVRHKMRKELAYFDEVIGSYEDAEDLEYTEDDPEFDLIQSFDDFAVREGLQTGDQRLTVRDDEDFVLNPRMDPSEITVGEPMDPADIDGEDEHEEEEELEDEETSVYNVFEAANDGWDWAEETANRTTINPYILHQDEYVNDEKGYSQSTLTYYEGDDTLVDEHDTPIQNIKACLGRNNLRWGHGASNDDLVYIRNDRFKSEYEVIRDPGMYSVEVLGNDVEDAYAESDLRHSKDQMLRFVGD